MIGDKFSAIEKVAHGALCAMQRPNLRSERRCSPAAGPTAFPERAGPIRRLTAFSLPLSRDSV